MEGRNSLIDHQYVVNVLRIEEVVEGELCIVVVVGFDACNVFIWPRKAAFHFRCPPVGSRPYESIDFVSSLHDISVRE